MLLRVNKRRLTSSIAQPAGWPRPEAHRAADTGITAAVVGVILNLAVFFAIHVLWPQGTGGRFEWPSALIGVAAGVALFRFKVGVIPVVLTSGLAGLALRLIA